MEEVHYLLDFFAPLADTGDALDRAVGVPVRNLLNILGGDQQVSIYLAARGFLFFCVSMTRINAFAFRGNCFCTCRHVTLPPSFLIPRN
jgi:hypothetical protein